ncbi:MAG: GH1 family beta-glucosidase [Paracoccaceae bacterium]
MALADLSRRSFPDGFLFGAATSAYQIEGSGFGGAGLSHWDTFAATPGNAMGGHYGQRACEHYLRWESDLDLIRDAGMDAYRFSVNWARVQPDGYGPANPEGLDFYERLVDGMLERGLKPCLTLYHWDLPAALARRGGWMNRDVADWFADYARLVSGRLGDRVASVATINEPWCVAWLSHFHGAHAPGLRDVSAAAHAMHHVLLAHGRATEAMRAEAVKNLGIVLNFEHIAPATDRTEDVRAAAREDAIYNRWFIQALTKGTYPDEALEGLGRWMPKGWQSDMDQISVHLDWLGVNYYRRALKVYDPGALWPAVTERPGPLPKTSMGWEIYPDGLRHRLEVLARDYVGDLPIFVTENGMAGDDSLIGETVDDPVRLDYIDTHLRAVQAAIGNGANVRGFFYWSLLDNYEWAFGYDKRFGLVHVDFATQTRTPKSSYHALARMLRRNE